MADEQIPGLDFVSLDFETANPSRASVIQIGIVKVRDGVPGKVHCLPVRPPLGHETFHPRNIAVHGLTARYLAGAAPWRDIYARFEKFTRDLPVVAHNAAFEKSVVNAACEASGIVPAPFEYRCSVKLVQRLIPEAPNHKLNTIAEFLGVDAFEHHDAGADALAAARVVVATAHRSGLPTIGQLWPTGTPKKTRTDVRNAA